MPEAWTGDLVGRMHNARVTVESLAMEMGCTKGYVSQILNGKRKPKDAKKRLNEAFASVLEKREETRSCHD